MALKAGYKHSEVGVIPEDWEVLPLGNLASFRTGPFGSALHQSDYINNGIPVINPMHIKNGLITPSPQMTISDIKAKKLSDFIVNHGEIIIGRRGDMGRCAIVQKNQTGWLCGTGSMIIKPLNINVDFLQIILSSSRAISDIENASVGTTMVNINQNSLAQLKIQTPPLPEQRAIAQALSDMDALLGALDQIIAKKRDIKQATMQQLLTGKTRLPGFSGAWEEKRLGDVAEIHKGKGLSKQRTFAGGNRPCILYGELFTNYGRVICDVIGRTNSGDGFQSVNGDVLMPSSTTTTGIDLATASALLQDNISLGGDILVIRQKIVVYDSIFLANYLTYAKKHEVAELTQGITIHHLYGKDLQSLMICIPAIAEQTAIAAVLSDMDTELSALETRREKTRQLKQAMMQELLTGKTRLKPA